MDEMAPFRVLNQVRAIKPGASILATATGEGGTRFPAVVAQRFGEGRVLALTIGDFWRWGARNAEDQEDMAKAWRQMARWEMADVPRQVVVSASREMDEWSGQSVRVAARVRDREFEPLENARVEMTVTEPGGGTIELVGDASGGEAGLYEATTVAARDGGYRVAAAVRDEDGELIANEETGWTMDSTSEEFRRVIPDRELMEKLATRSGGKCVSLDGLADLVAELPGREAPVMDVRSNPLWHTPWIFLLALGCFAAEWALRRRGGLV